MISPSQIRNVDGVLFKAGFNPIEAKRTAELVFEHIQRHGSRLLGVITFNLHSAQ